MVIGPDFPREQRLQGIHRLKPSKSYEMNKYHSCRWTHMCRQQNGAMDPRIPTALKISRGKTIAQMMCEAAWGRNMMTSEATHFPLTSTWVASLINAHIFLSLGGLPGRSSFTCSSIICSKGSGKRVVKIMYTNALGIYLSHY